MGGCAGKETVPHDMLCRRLLQLSSGLACVCRELERKQRSFSGEIPSVRLLSSGGRNLTSKNLCGLGRPASGISRGPGDSAGRWFMGKGAKFIGEILEAWIQSLVFVYVIPSALAAPIVVAPWAQLFVVADIRTGQQVTTSAMISVPLSVV